MGWKRVAVAPSLKEPPRFSSELERLRERAVLERVPELAVVLDGVAVAEFTGSTRQSFIGGQLPFQDRDRDLREPKMRDVGAAEDRHALAIHRFLSVDVA